ncbi:TonB-dependent receptor [Frigoriflavimonas asaccharolytica]|uniref:Carboxypeptidase family protein n=1 Tax=Frigoriflavimonas asaccharolytica TaxID=2735899 RepID=A0A8J8K9N7_9FLAO|nr:TonB-dependent receptor [Frigoriflavimonas asaccharolytica]NRS93978.1 hypothetical protein [Frigoriflavimonas asaccharolytica]
MKKHLSVFLFLFLMINAFAQKTVSGVVKNNEGERVPSASVTVEEPGKDAIIAYAISNSKGEYTVTFTSSAANVDVKIKAFNHKATTQQIKNDTQTYNFNLQTEATEIEEVKLKTRIITKKGDTIEYNLKEFENKNDRTLADVLAKIPGVEVNKDGSVLYQGEPLIKFYVNGKDIMEGGYGIINKALPKDAVASVQVLENHQPVKILEDKVPSDQAAFNIKLKKQVTMTGRAEIGAGTNIGESALGDDALFNAKVTPMFFGQKNQWVVNYKANNVGDPVENEGNLFSFGSRFEGTRRSNAQNSWLDVEKASTPNLPISRYLFNRVHYFSANVLTTPFKNKEWELKASGSYTNNDVERASYTERFDKLFNQTSTFERDNRFFTNKAKGELIFTKNAKLGFFKNVTTFNQYWNADRANVNLFDGAKNERKFSEQALESPSTSFQNSLSTIIPWKSKLLNLQSFISYQNDDQTLRSSPGNYLFFPGTIPSQNLFENAEKINQYFNIETFEANHSATMGFTYKKWTITPEIGYNFLTNDVYSQLTQISAGNQFGYGPAFNNDLKFRQSVPYANLGLNYKNENWSASIRLPANFTNITAEDPLRNLNQDFSKTTFEPSGFVQYSFASFFKTSVFGNVNYRFADVNNLYAGYILGNPTNISSNDFTNPVSENLSKSAGGRLEYRNPLNNLFFNVNYNYSNTKNNLISDFTGDGTGFGVLKFVERDNEFVSNSQNVEVGKYFPKYKSNVSVSFRNSDSTSELARLGDFYDNDSSSQNLGFKLNNSFFSWMSFDYNFTMGWSTNESIFASTSNESFNHNLNLIFYPIENHSIALNWDQINSSLAGQTYKNAFYDLTYQFAWSKKNIDFELKWLNIANKNLFERIDDGAFSTSISRIQIRPSQIMATVKFNFK